MIGLRLPRRNIAITLLLVFATSACETGIQTAQGPQSMALGSDPTAFFGAAATPATPAQARQALLMIAAAMTADTPVAGVPRFEAHSYADSGSGSSASIQVTRSETGRMTDMRFVDNGRTAHLQIAWGKTAAGVEFVQQIAVERAGWTGRANAATVTFAEQEVMPGGGDDGDGGPCQLALLAAGLSLAGYYLAFGCLLAAATAGWLCLLAILVGAGASTLSLLAVASACFGVDLCATFGGIFCPNGLE
jgi:hypothetical protein